MNNGQKGCRVPLLFAFLDKHCDGKGKCTANVGYSALGAPATGVLFKESLTECLIDFGVNHGNTFQLQVQGNNTPVPTQKGSKQF